MESLEYQQWKALGDKVKAVRSELFGILEDSQKLVKGNKKTMDILVDSIRKFNEFKGVMEDKMFEQVKPPDSKRSNYLWLHVFYGENKKEGN